MEKDYRKLLEDLYHKKIEYLDISAEEYMQFQKEYVNFEYRKNILGKAQKRGGARFYLVH
ncbi:hypothetical protein [Ligilactobacillus ceti]|uniref:Uncharacterized protein n=1 Tax=Ligilactobacillus ceti DSM 22408 TaxID=1122146 RepID=A0A0R2KVF4_9LACO|nr:hypothetical protein [Ligilactobacillus ceti]KRN90375.1 hypothetical protein IV53_GL000290 [Ligilactobacillus ceti DSM 22408]